MNEGTMWAIMGELPDGTTSLVLTPNTVHRVAGRPIYSPVLSADREQVQATLDEMLAAPDGRVHKPFLAEVSWRRI